MGRTPLCEYAERWHTGFSRHDGGYCSGRSAILGGPGNCRDMLVVSGQLVEEGFVAGVFFEGFQEHLYVLADGE